MVYSTFLQVVTVMSCSFIISFATPGRLQKSFFNLLFTHRKIHHHHHHSAYYTVAFLHRCIYTLQYIPDDNFYLVCRQNRSLTLPLHCNTCHMEHLDHKNLSLCVLSTFLTYHRRTCFSFYGFCRHLFK